MTPDPYRVLELPWGASEAEIKRAFRSIARRFHPDVAGEDPVASERFMEAREAYELLMDPPRRERVHRRHARRRAPPESFFDAFYRRTGGGGRSRVRRGEGGNDLDLDDLFQDLSDDGRSPSADEEGVVGSEERVLEISVSQAVLGAEIGVTTPGGGVVLKIPPCTSSGLRLRLGGKGPRNDRGIPGDLIVRVRIVTPSSLDARSRALMEAFAKLNP